MKKQLKAIADLILGPVGLELRRRPRHDWTDTTQFIPFAETLAAARAAGLSVGEYIDTVMNGVPGATERTFSDIAAIGVFSQPLRTVVEIGPGSGRYLEKTIKACRPLRYEIYETAVPWAEYLVRKYGVAWLPTDGRTLAGTPSETVDLVHAHKTFNSIPFLATLRYWIEMSRVTRPGGFVIFDVITERCLNTDVLRQWAGTTHETGSYPATIPAEVAERYFASEGFSKVGGYFTPLQYGNTEGFVFRKQG